MAHPMTIGVSACLLGERVRYDGSHKHDPADRTADAAEALCYQV